MSQPNSTNWKNISIGFIIVLLVIAVISMSYLYNATLNDKNTLQTQYNALKATDQTNLQQIQSLQQQVSMLQTQHSSDQATINSLNATITSLNTEITKLEAANIIAQFAWNSVCTSIFCFFPSYTNTVTSIAFANTGTLTANAPTLKVSFYSGPNGTGSLLCTTPPISLGNVLGTTVTLSTSGGSCNSGDIQAMSATGSVNWS